MGLETYWSLLSCSDPISYEPLLPTHKCEFLTKPAACFPHHRDLLTFSSVYMHRAEGFVDHSTALWICQGSAGPSRNMDRQIHPIFVPFAITSELHPHSRKQISLLLLPFQHFLSNASSTLCFWLSSKLHKLHFTLFVRLCHFAKTLLPLLYLRYLSTRPLITLSPPSLYLCSEILMQGKWHQLSVSEKWFSVCLLTLLLLFLAPHPTHTHTHIQYTYTKCVCVSL